MPHIDQTLRIVPLSAKSSPAVVKAAQHLLREYGEFVLASTGPARFCAARLSDEIESPAQSYASRKGELLLAFVGDDAAGCVGFRSLIGAVGERACELKRMWVRPPFRGVAMGQALVQAVFVRAVAAGYETMYLDTEPHAMGAALRLYQRLGFEECPAYTDEVADGLRFFRRSLP